MTSLTERIEARARHARPGRAVAVLVASVLFGLGWLAFKTCALAWLALAWCGSALAEGWISARAGQEAP